MKEYVKSNLKSVEYKPKDVCRILNPKQQMLYIKNGIYPIDIYTSIDSKTENDVIVMIFSKNETTEVYKKWCNYELE